MAITKTIVDVVNTDSLYELNADFTPEQVVAVYGEALPDLRSMESTTSITGDVKTITFKPRTGNKG